MPSDGDSFLPRIQSVFYAVFDVRQGPKIVYQVPEGLIAVSASGPASSVSGALPFSPSTLPSTPSLEVDNSHSRNSSTSLISPVSLRPNSRALPSPQKRPSSSNRTLFHFDDISKYVIPPSALYGRLVTCATKKHRLIGFPVELKGNYPRNYFRYNLCFVFERTADLSCYEPIVRKVSRVLTTCEEESSFLSSPETSHTMHAILEQLYEDLNSYSETSIPIDKFNSIELKIFPFYPNPPAVKDWMVPLALINLTKRIEANWDLTIAKICVFIDGTNHVSRIAHLADCDLELTRKAVSHLLYYQVIMTIDIFQYSNMYTLRKSIQWLADEAHVRDECGTYSTKPGRPIPDWPTLLYLYSRLKPGVTVFDWMARNGVNDLGIDVRRFTSFGVIKGFLRRIHRWPMLLPDKNRKDEEAEAEPLSPLIRRKRGSISMVSTPIASTDPSAPLPERESPRRFRTKIPDPSPIGASLSTASVTSLMSSDPTAPLRKASVAETALENQLRRGLPRLSSHLSGPRGTKSPGEMQLDARSSPPEAAPRQSALSTYSAANNPLGALGASNAGHNASRTSLAGSATPVTRPLASRSPSAPTVHTGQPQSFSSHHGPRSAPVLPCPDDFPSLLDGEHHTDELATRFQVGWPVLKKWLVLVGKGQGDDDFGNVVMIYR